MWMRRMIIDNGHVSLMDLLERYIHQVSLEDNDFVSYHDVGWNILDFDVLFVDNHENDLRIPNPKLHFKPRYT